MPTIRHFMASIISVFPASGQAVREKINRASNPKIRILWRDSSGLLTLKCPLQGGENKRGDEDIVT